MALRAALGASRMRIIRQLLTESVMLSVLGGVLGLLIAQWGTAALIQAVPQNIPRIATIELDGIVLAFTIVVSLATGIIFGLVPAWQASRVDLNTSLKSGSRTGSGGERKGRLRNGLVMAEVALALVLLICAGLLIQSFARLGRVQPGVKTERLLTARVQLPDIAYPKNENIIAFFDQFLPKRARASRRGIGKRDHAAAVERQQHGDELRQGRGAATRRPTSVSTDPHHRHRLLSDDGHLRPRRPRV